MSVRVRAVTALFRVIFLRAFALVSPSFQARASSATWLTVGLPLRTTELLNGQSSSLGCAYVLSGSFMLCMLK